MAISTFTGLETALRGLMAQQQALDITGQNITNASTPGYTRQTVSLATTPELQTAPGVELGTGVTVTGYQRVRDAFLDVQYRAQSMLQGSAQASEDGLGQVENVINEPSSTGLNSLLSAYWSAWQTVSNQPQDMAARQSLVEAATSLTQGFNGISSQLSTIQSQTSQNIALTVAQANSDGATIQKLNAAIATATAAGDSPNDLLDQRDSALDDLSSLGSVSAVNNSDGTVTVSFDGVTLADATNAYTLSVSGTTISNNKPTPETASVSATNGKLGALINLSGTTIPGYQSTLNTIASTLITQTNAIQAGGNDVNGVAHAGGYGLDGSTGVDFFSGSDASDIAVNVTAAQVAAASTASAPGDNTNALAMANIQTDTTLAPLNGATIDGAYDQLVTTIGSDSQSAQRSTSNANVIVQSIQNQRDSVSSVSMDEEMTNLVKYQQGYQASARALTTMDDVLELLITRTGRVGL
jgi:flagellar hook-associated protein 1 FlgK